MTKLARLKLNATSYRIGNIACNYVENYTLIYIRGDKNVHLTQNTPHENLQVTL